MQQSRWKAANQSKDWRRRKRRGGRGGGRGGGGRGGGEEEGGRRQQHMNYFQSGLSRLEFQSHFDSRQLAQEIQLIGRWVNNVSQKHMSSIIWVDSDDEGSKFLQNGIHILHTTLHGIKAQSTAMLIFTLMKNLVSYELRDILR